MARAVGEWQNQTDAWLLGLSDNHKKDLADLARAESHLLWQNIDQYKTYRHKANVEWLREDFRERWFILVPLVEALKRLDIDKVLIDDVCDFATEMGWLP